jgi:YbbR domain-containing protein
MRDWLIKDFGWKLFSLLLAAFIWYTVHKVIEEPKPASAEPATMQIPYADIPVLIVAAAADRHLFQLNSNTVSVTLSGTPAALSGLKPQQIRATVDLSNFDPQAGSPARAVDVSVPWDVTVVDVAPAEVRVIPPGQR